MMFLSLLFLAAAQPPLSREPFMDEPKAADAFEAQLNCVAKSVFDRREDKRRASAIAAEVVSVCGPESARLRNALTDVYQRKPQLRSGSQSSDQAAAAYVNAMNERVEALVLQTRKP